ncbi:MAG: hypothetical protein JJU01_09415, partial [Alkalibacterium sp.]|nr:hypothetical protein [Alkalibacterium sp.]
MKKGLQLTLVVMLFIQHLATLPLSVIAEDWSTDSNMNFSEVTLIDSEGESIDSVEQNSDVTVQLNWEATSHDDSERTLVLPDALLAHPGSDVLLSESGEEAGEYIKTDEQLTLKSNGKHAGRFSFEARMDAVEIGDNTLVFHSNGEEWVIGLEINESTDDEIEGEDSEEIEEPARSDDQNLEEVDEDEFVQDNNADLSSESEADEQDSTQDSETNESDMTEENEESVSLVEIDEQLQFSNVSFTDRDGVEYSADNPYNLNASPIGRLSFDWFLVDGHAVTGGDTYSFELPDEFRPVAGTSGQLGDIGTWSVNAAGVVTFLFNEAVDGDEVSGSFWFEVSLDEDALREEIEQNITFDLVPEVTISFPVTPKNSGLIDKEGTINNEGFNSTQAFWTVDINTALNTLVSPTVTDTIPDYMTYFSDSLEIV